MHRIDGPGATVDNKFTEGDPVSGVAATTVTDDWLNAVQEEIMAVLAAVGIAPVKASNNQLLAAIRSLSSGPIVSASNARMTLTAASSTTTFTADEVIVGTALGGQSYRLSNFNKTVNLATTGAGGMDTGTAPVNGWVALYAIYNPTSGASSILAVNSPNAVMPAVYGGANMPAGYTASALLTVVPTNASGQFKVVCVRGRDVHIQLTTAYSGNASVVGNPISIAGIIPANAVAILNGELSLQNTSQSAMSLTITPDASALGQQNLTSLVSGSGAITANYAMLPVTVDQTMMFTSSSSAGTPTYSIYVGGYRL
ncbi:hypothetical protein [Pseudomonas asiatica]|uniref:Phage tail protein n=1 Tax=Pseudomonas asiatica TaxID=2219225 RepID=A0A9X4D3N6_9PSED|nr:hypothetical protein [Pseudomonas asiatica]MDD2109306.1 hypothetical protein [Pseudomonas asiatica]